MSFPLAPARYTLSRALVVTRRELRDQLRDWRIIFPVLVLTLFFPLLMDFTAKRATDFVAQYGANIVGERLIPFLLMVVGFFPISVSLVIALESFVGEKERHSLEPLLVTPLTNAQLYIGKVLAATLPPVVASYLAIGVYLTGLHFTIGWAANPLLLIQIVALTTMQAIVMVSASVVISAQTTSVRAANLLASFVIIPVALLVQAESLIMFWARYEVLWWVMAGLGLVDVLLIRMGVHLFSREELLGREIDEVNLRAAWRTLRREFAGRAGGSLARWYRVEIVAALRRIALPCLAIAIALAAAILLGASQASRFPLPRNAIPLDKIDSGFVERMSYLGLFSPRAVGLVLLVNMRALMLATLLGVVSFGAMAVVLLMVPLGLVGYFAASAAAVGFSPWLFLAAFILPHGILEIPAAVLMGGAILRLGATVIAPPPDRSLSEAWLAALADWLKLGIGVAVPLLLGAAVLEAFVTPRVVASVFGG
jgi:uncharacterized membrane protein SpoIIM required for sporulation